MLNDKARWKDPHPQRDTPAYITWSILATLAIWIFLLVIMGAFSRASAADAPARVFFTERALFVIFGGCAALDALLHVIDSAPLRRRIRLVAAWVLLVAGGAGLAFAGPAVVETRGLYGALTSALLPATWAVFMGCVLHVVLRWERAHPPRDTAASHLTPALSR